MYMEYHFLEMILFNNKKSYLKVILFVEMHIQKPLYLNKVLLCWRLWLKYIYIS